MRADSGRECKRDERETGRERSPAEHVLKIERAEQEEPEDRARGGQHQHEPATDCTVGHAADVKERRVDVQLVDGERGEAGQPAETAEVRLDRRPAGGVRLRDPVYDYGEAGGRERRPGEG